MIVKQQVNKFFGDDKQLLKLAFESTIESLLKDPFRLQSFFEYSMSVASKSTSSLTPDDNGNHEKQSFHGQFYPSLDYESNSKQVELLKYMILDESEKFYNKKVEEFTNMAVSAAAANDNNQLSLTSDEKESITELLLLKFTEYE
jgi:hypothetical protein